MTWIWRCCTRLASLLRASEDTLLAICQRGAAEEDGATKLRVLVVQRNSNKISGDDEEEVGDVLLDRNGILITLKRRGRRDVYE